MPDDTTEAQISRMIDAASEYIGLTHEAPWPKERQAARDAVIELGRLAYSAASARQSAIEEGATLAETKAAEFRALEPLLEDSILSATVLEDHAVMVRQLGFSGEKAK